MKIKINNGPNLNMDDGERNSSAPHLLYCISVCTGYKGVCSYGLSVKTCQASNARRIGRHHSSLTVQYTMFSVVSRVYVCTHVLMYAGVMWSIHAPRLYMPTRRCGYARYSPLLHIM